MLLSAERKYRFFPAAIDTDVGTHNRQKKMKMPLDLFMELEAKTTNWFRKELQERDHLKGKTWYVVNSAMKEIAGSGHWLCIQLQEENGDTEEVRSRLERTQNGDKVFAALLRESRDNGDNFIHHVEVY